MVNIFFSIWACKPLYLLPGQVINADGLQEILNGVFLGDQKTSKGFSLDSCRAIVLLMDFSGTGRLDKHDFRRLWEKLLLFKELFHKRDMDGTGLLHPTQLSDSLQEVGFTVANSALNLMTLRFGDSSGMISLESFTNCFLRVEFTTEMYTRLSKGDAGLSLTEAEVRKSSWQEPILSIGIKLLIGVKFPESVFSHRLRGYQNPGREIE
ncbi:calpain-3-like [Rhincodon typus]|uniref:calpain-3-like n=1 Tax=Rhincodon typus TaxID=259920 RepID=UPI0020308A2E|nr:calpain-3-like [Rhincodon typus]